MNLGVLQTNCGKFKMSCQRNTGWQSVMSIYVRGLGMVKPVHAQHLLFQGSLQTVPLRWERRGGGSSKQLHSVFFSSLSHSTGQTLLPPELGAGVLSPRAAEASLQSPSVTATSREPALNLRERLQGSLMCVQQQYQKVKTDSSQKKISMACEILSNVCWMHEPPFHYFCIRSAPSELLPCLLLTVVSTVYLLSCRSPVLLPLPHNHWIESGSFCLSVHQL